MAGLLAGGPQYRSLPHRRPPPLLAQTIHEAARDGDHAAYNGFTPLMLAARFGRLEVVRLLLDKGAKLELRSSFDATALEQAADGKHTAVVDLLLAKGARYSLATAIARNDLAGCRRALQQDPRAAQAWRPMWDACRKGHAEVVALLLEHGAPKSTRGSAATRASWTRTWTTRRTTAELLIRAGDKDGKRPIDWTTDEKKHAAVRTLLREHGGG